MVAPYHKSIKILIGILIVYAVLVATHLGEFWPFSIYPMFSQGGKPWSRTVVRDVTEVPAFQFWHTVDEAGLPGTAVGLESHGIAADDIANYVSKTKVWDKKRLAGLKKVFDMSGLGERNLLVMKVEGRLDGQDQVVIRYVPYVWVRTDSVLLNPKLTL